MEELRAALLRLRARIDELSAKRQQYLAFFEQAADAHLITDRAGVIREANGAAVALLERRARALRGKPLAALVSLKHRTAFRAQLGTLAKEWRTVLAAGASAIEVDVALRPAASGALCWRLRPAH